VIRRQQVLHTICGQDCAQAQHQAPSTLIYIVFIASIKKQAEAEKGRYQPLPSQDEQRFPSQRQFRTKNVDKIVSKHLGSNEDR